MKILLAEDDRTSRTLMTGILTPTYELVVTENGAEAWIALQTQPDIEVAIIDLHMPEVSGIEFLERVRAHPSFAKLPVIVCTGDSDRATVARVAALGIMSYLVKPYTRSSVLEKVSQILRPRAASPAATALNDIEGVRERLNIDRDGHRALLEHHIRVADMWLTDARRASRFSEVRALAIRVTHLREASAQLGAAALAAKLQEAEDTLAKFRTAPFTLAQLQACLKAVVGEADKIQPELARIRAVAEALP